MERVIAIVGIHTGIGKTISSAVIAEALQADYWKPVQAGDLENSDSVNLRKLLSNGDTRVHPEAVKLTQPMSPHEAAKIDGVTIDYKNFQLPQSSGTLLVETAGGVLSPMTDTATMADFVKHFNLPVILVSNNYLGSINHTLLSIEVLKNRQIPILGIMMNGAQNASSENYIESYTQVPIIARIPFFETLDAAHVKQCATEIRTQLLQNLEDGKH